MKYNIKELLFTLCFYIFEVISALVFVLITWFKGNDIWDNIIITILAIFISGLIIDRIIDICKSIIAITEEKKEEDKNEN
jgi:uncharacterized membrane-anchored protein YitT (DUF2179 family)